MVCGLLDLLEQCSRLGPPLARGQGPVEELGVGSVTAARAREEEYHPLSRSALALLPAPES